MASVTDRLGSITNLTQNVSVAANNAIISNDISSYLTTVENYIDSSSDLSY